ncbi:MAG: ABC transporter substrate-binding protein [Clostridiales Family XIII bacterium]|jgi:simple sugar transport system substrate-binding protein|nr:ABC transporter substrate-binding protein [Clostridiales Family XIII bacterium]
MKKIVLTALLAVAMVFAFAACGGQPADDGDDAAAPAAEGSESESPATDASADGPLVVGFSQVGAESDWRTANTQSMKDTFSEANGYKLIFDDAQQKQENQITAIRNFIQQEVNYIVLAPVTETGWDTVLQEAKDAGIPVIIVDRMIDVSDDTLFTCWVGSDFRAEGDKAVAWMEEKFADTPNLNIVHLQGTIGSSAQIGRTEGLEVGAEKNAGWKLVAQQTGEFTQAKGQEVMESILKQNPDINVVYAENDNMAFGAIDAMTAAGKTFGVGGDIAVISFDATHAGLEDTLAGKIDYNVECNPLHGPRVAAIIEQMQNGETPEKLAYVDEVAFDATTITQEEIDARAY